MCEVTSRPAKLAPMAGQSCWNCRADVAVNGLGPGLKGVDGEQEINGTGCVPPLLLQPSPKIGKYGDRK
jgi:hypothetical protein